MMPSRILSVMCAASLLLFSVRFIDGARPPYQVDRSTATASFMNSSESLIGVQGYPFHAGVDADWTVAGANNPSVATKAHGEIWRDAIGDVRLNVLIAGNEPSRPPLLEHAIVFRGPEKQEIMWNSKIANAVSISLAKYPETLFEDIIIPAAVRSFHSLVFECLKKGVECSTVPLGTKTIDSHPATGRRYMAVISAGQTGAARDVVHTRDVWINPRTNVVVLIDDTDPRSGTFTMRLSNFSAGDQSSSLFQPPEGYKIKAITPAPQHPLQ